MPRLVGIGPELFDGLHDAFLREDDPRWTDEAEWRRVFLYEWDFDADHRGYALVEDDRVVGMMGMAFSRRVIRGVERRLCNPHTWWVHPDYRGHAVMMLMPIVKMRDRTLTYFTPGDRVRGLLRPLGFRPVDMQLRVLLPVGPRGQTVDIAFDGDAGDLDADERRLMDDHRPYGMHHLWLGGACLVHYTFVERYRFRYCHIHRVSDRDLFLAHEEAVRSAIMRRHGVRAVALDMRLWRGHAFRRSFAMPPAGHGLFRPAEGDDIHEEDIDHLYSDVTMLRLTTMPSVRHELLEPLRRRFTPGRVKPS